MTSETPPSTPASPRVSVIIPAYNAADYVVQAVESALSQSPECPQVIVIDDGSHDNTAALVAEIAAKSPAVTLIQQENAGCPSARLTGLARATGEFFIFLDADDVLLPGAIAAHVAAMDSKSQAVMVFGSNDRIDETGRQLAVYQHDPFETDDPHYVSMWVTPAPSQCMYRKAAFEEIGGYDGSLRLCEDSDINIRITQLGSIHCHGAMVLSYRMHGGQLTKKPSRICRQHLDIIRRHLGPAGFAADPAALAKALRRWKRYYGQNIPMEILRMAKAGQGADFRAALGTFVTCLPHSFLGFAEGLPRLLRHRFGRPASA